MGKYDAIRKSLPARPSTHSLAPRTSYIPTVRRAVIDDTQVQRVVFPPADVDLDLDDLFEELDELPIPEFE